MGNIIELPKRNQDGESPRGPAKIIPFPASQDTLHERIRRFMEEGYANEEEQFMTQVLADAIERMTAGMKPASQKEDALAFLRAVSETTKIRMGKIDECASRGESMRALFVVRGTPIEEAIITAMEGEFDDPEAVRRKLHKLATQADLLQERISADQF